jgi:hypothetical protein
MIWGIAVIDRFLLTAVFLFKTHYASRFYCLLYQEYQIAFHCLPPVHPRHLNVSQGQQQLSNIGLVKLLYCEYFLQYFSLLVLPPIKGCAH